MRDFNLASKAPKEPKKYQNLDPFGDFEDIDMEQALAYETNMISLDAKEEDNIMCCC